MNTYFLTVLVQMHSTQRKQFNVTNVTTHFQKISDLKICPECFRGPLKTLWLVTHGPRAANCPPPAPDSSTFSVSVFFY